MIELISSLCPFFRTNGIKYIKAIDMIHFETELKARTYECDMYGHVNNAAFLNYCEFARVEFLENLGFTLQSLKEAGFVLPIVRVEIEYKWPVFANEILSISVDWVLRGKSSAVFEQTIFNKTSNKISAKVKVTWVVTDLKGKPIAMPDSLLDRLQEAYGELPPKKTV